MAPRKNPIRMPTIRSLRGGSFSEDDQQAVPKLIIEQDWTALRALFASERRSQGLVKFLRTPRTSGDNPVSKETVLHLCCRVRPPLDVILLVYSAFPEAVYLSDMMGRYPIHIAVKYGAAPDVIDLLIEKNKVAAGMQDITGKTPLHLTCENYLNYYNRGFEGPGAPSTTDAILTVVTKLCQAAPSAVNLEDMDDMSALEYAIESGIPLKVVKKLQKTSEQDWKGRRIMVDTHVHAEQDLQKQCQERKEKLQKDVLAITSAAVNLSLSPTGSAGAGQGLEAPMLPKRRKAVSSRALTA